MWPFSKTKKTQEILANIEANELYKFVYPLMHENYDYANEKLKEISFRFYETSKKDYHVNTLFLFGICSAFCKNRPELPTTTTERAWLYTLMFTNSDLNLPLDEAQSEINASMDCLTKDTVYKYSGLDFVKIGCKAWENKNEENSNIYLFDCYSIVDRMTKNTLKLLYG